MLHPGCGSELIKGVGVGHRVHGVTESTRLTGLCRVHGSHGAYMLHPVVALVFQGIMLRGYSTIPPNSSAPVWSPIRP